MSDIKKTPDLYLVGAGPGDPGLISVKGMRLVEECDILIYDNLVSGLIVERAPEKCEKIYVGKSGSEHTLEQDEINRLLVEKGRGSGIVVRLKGGDPFIFGRGGEEALALHKAGIPFEIVPGISSAYSAPAYAGIPVTHRAVATSVAFITGHEDPTKNKSQIDWASLASEHQTLVFLMGVKNLPMIASQLIKNGRPASTPAAVIMNGTLPSQRTVTGTLENISETAKSGGIKPPSIIVIGKVAALRDQLNWFETTPLFGKKIIVTRSREQASKLSSGLRVLGAEVLEIPAIKIVQPVDKGPIEKAVSSLSSYDWIIFTSINGVGGFFDTLSSAGLDSRSLAGKLICAIGPATADALAARGIKADLVPEKYISTEIISALKKTDAIKDKRFLLPRADIAPEDIVKELMASGAASADDVTVYRTVESDEFLKPETSAMLKKGEYDLVTFTSSSTVRNFKKILIKAGGSPSGIKTASIGPITSSTAETEGFSTDIIADVHTIDGLISAILSDR